MRILASDSLSGDFLLHPELPNVRDGIWEKVEEGLLAKHFRAVDG
jgi:hypothetical protein